MLTGAPTAPPPHVLAATLASTSTSTTKIQSKKKIQNTRNKLVKNSRTKRNYSNWNIQIQHKKIKKVVHGGSSTLALHQTSARTAQEDGGGGERGDGGKKDVGGEDVGKEDEGEEDAAEEDEELARRMNREEDATGDAQQKALIQIQGSKAIKEQTAGAGNIMSYVINWFISNSMISRSDGLAATVVDYRVPHNFFYWRSAMLCK